MDKKSISNEEGEIKDYYKYSLQKIIIWEDRWRSVINPCE
jgi:hypothetical protein